MSILTDIICIEKAFKGTEIVFVLTVFLLTRFYDSLTCSLFAKTVLYIYVYCSVIPDSSEVVIFLHCCPSSYMNISKLVVCNFQRLATLRGTRGIKIYTKTGDKGLTSNYVGNRIPKDDVVVEALGSTDELSSQIGLTRAWITSRHSSAEHQELLALLASVQCCLQDIGSHIATPPHSKQAGALPALGAELVKDLESRIDDMTSQLPPLKQFILPGGGVTAGHLHVARSVCRRSERRVVPLVRAGDLSDQVGVYLNRLSDFLFTAARWVSHLEGEKDTIYTSG